MGPKKLVLWHRAVGGGLRYRSRLHLVDWLLVPVFRACCIIPVGSLRMANSRNTAPGGRGLCRALPIWKPVLQPRACSWRRQWLRCGDPAAFYGRKAAGLPCRWFLLRFYAERCGGHQPGPAWLSTTGGDRLHCLARQLACSRSWNMRSAGCGGAEVLRPCTALAYLQERRMSGPLQYFLAY